MNLSQLIQEVYPAAQCDYVRIEANLGFCSVSLISYDWTPLFHLDPKICAKESEICGTRARPRYSHESDYPRF